MFNNNAMEICVTHTHKIEGQTWEVAPKGPCPTCGETMQFVFLPSINLKICNKNHTPTFIDWSLKDKQPSVLIKGLIGGCDVH
jgi:hypothetical protein